jgi:hypothetical protein
LRYDPGSERKARDWLDEETTLVDLSRQRIRVAAEKAP